MSKHNLLEGSLPRHMARLAAPTVLGMLSFTIFNLTDTYFVSGLGVESLAAMGFTFPVVMMVGAVSNGISAGAASLVSRAKGADNKEDMQAIATNGILLSLVAVVIVSILGLLTMDPLFTLLGADSSTLPLVKQYMTIWYLGVVACVMPPVGDSCMRAAGDMMRPLIVMMICAFTNVILDPLLIYGVWIFPEMGIAGAALATVISRSCGMVATLYFAARHHNLIKFDFKHGKKIVATWKRILHLGVPNITTQLMPQLLRTVMTAMAASGGTVAVAALAAGTKIESFATVVTMGFGTALIPLIGQNWGAGKYDRALKVRNISFKFGIIYGAFIFVLMFLVGKPIATIFTNDPEVIQYTAYYLCIMMFGLAGLSITNWVSQAFTTIGKPRYTFGLNVFGTGLVVMPAAVIGNYIGGFVGMLIGVALAQTVLGVIAMILAVREMKPEIE